jgi:hypothetical protein
MSLVHFSPLLFDFNFLDSSRILFYFCRIIRILLLDLVMEETSDVCMGIAGSQHAGGRVAPWHVPWCSSRRGLHAAGAVAMLAPDWRRLGTSQKAYSLMIALSRPLSIS